MRTYDGKLTIEIEITVDLDAEVDRDGTIEWGSDPSVVESTILATGEPLPLGRAARDLIRDRLAGRIGGPPAPPAPAATQFFWEQCQRSIDDQIAGEEAALALEARPEPDDDRDQT